jgi:hypothetical protein
VASREIGAAQGSKNQPQILNTMKLSAGDISKFPKFAQYVKDAIPTLIGVPRIINSLKKNGSMTDAEIQSGLLWGNNPLVVITDLSAGQCGVPSAFGCTRASSLTQIEIDKTTVENFEKAPYAQGTGVGKNAAGQNVFIVGVTLLHEFCHLGNFNHGKAETAEAGFAFEKDAYGKAIP